MKWVIERAKAGEDSLYLCPNPWDKKGIVWARSEETPQTLPCSFVTREDAEQFLLNWTFLSSVDWYLEGAKAVVWQDKTVERQGVAKAGKE